MSGHYHANGGFNNNISTGLRRQCCPDSRTKNDTTTANILSVFKCIQDAQMNALKLVRRLQVKCDNLLDVIAKYWILYLIHRRAHFFL